MKKTNWRKIKKQDSEQISAPMKPLHYAGLWSRLLSIVIDVFMIGMPIVFILMSLFGYEQMQTMSALDALEGIKPLDAAGNPIEPDPTMAITQIVLYATVVIGLWRFDGGRTPGKRLSKTKILDAKTFEAPALWQLVIRFFAYFLTFISFLLLIGFLLPLLHPKKQILHDYLSSTVVVYDLD